MLPKPFDMSGGKQFEDNFGLFTIWFTIDDDAVRGDIKIKLLLFSELEYVWFLQPGLEKTV